MTQLTLVVLDKKTLDRDDLNFASLEALGLAAHYYDYTSAEQVPVRLAQADIVITNKVVITADHIAQASHLKLICLAATGTNNVDLEAATHHQVAVTNIRNYGTPSVAQQVFALLLALITRLPEHQRAVRNGQWQSQTSFALLDFPFIELAGKCLGIVGYGVLGQAVAKLAQAFDMRVMVSERPVFKNARLLETNQASTTPVTAELTRETEPVRHRFQDVLAQADVLSLHCPLTEDNQRLINKHTLGMMKPSAYLINTARGGLVDETALAEALKSHRLAGAGLDVLAQEPPPETNVLLGLDLPNLIITPHVAWAARESRQRLLDQLAEVIASFQSGALINRVN